MDYPIKLEGFEAQQLTVKPAGWVTGPKLLINGQPAPKGPKRNQLLLQRDDGTEAVAELRNSALGLDPVPQLIVDGKPIHLAMLLKWYQWIWGGLPTVLVFVGGALGALCGLVAFGINARTFRSQRTNVIKYGITAGVSILAVIVYFILAVLFNLAIGR
ncbi:MAG: hypothetical protein NT169_09750 [Chloroflexi bacterium]|nr:hypothetical protein [Chloroflexota bacterium]